MQAQQVSAARLLIHEGAVGAVAWSPDGKWIAIASRDNSIRIWDTSTGELSTILEGFNAPASALVWSSDGRRLYSSYPALEVQEPLFIWDTATWTLLSTHANGSATFLALDHNSSRLANVVVGFNEGSILSGEAYETVLPFGKLTDRTNLMTTAVWSNDSSQLLTGSIGGGVHLWDATTGELIVRFGANPYYNPDRMGVPIEEVPLSWVRGVTFSPDGTIQAWNIATQTVTAVCSLTPLARQRGVLMVRGWRIYCRSWWNKRQMAACASSP
jgi:WD40 repeat protein